VLAAVADDTGTPQHVGDIDHERGVPARMVAPSRCPVDRQLPPSSRAVRGRLARGRRNPALAPSPRGVISGKVVDASALAALGRGRPSAVAWFATARPVVCRRSPAGTALAEGRAVRPEAGSQLAEVVGHPSVMLDDLGACEVD
jgi:hypothetical protein